jgi:2'-hydroxyisoflavone reductase
VESQAKFTWVKEEFLAKQNVQPWSDMPVWTGKDDTVARTNISRALTKGLTFRPLDVTARDTIVWFKSLPPERQSHPKAGLSAAREAEVLAEWNKRETRKS